MRNYVEPFFGSQSHGTDQGNSEVVWTEEAYTTADMISQSHSTDQGNSHKITGLQQAWLGAAVSQSHSTNQGNSHSGHCIFFVFRLLEPHFLLPPSGAIF